MTVIQQLSMDKWIQGIAQGDRDALEKFYAATSSAVYAYALSILQNPHDAEDVLQDCYIAVCRSAGEYRSQGKPMAWLMTITRNLCYKSRRLRQRYVSLDSGELFGRLEAPADDKLLMQSCMQVLTEEERSIVVLHAVAGCTHAEIGRHLNLKLGTVLSKYHRAIRKLRDTL